MRLFAYAISPEFEPGHEPAGLHHFDEVAKYDWLSAVQRVAPSLRAHSDALTALVGRALVPASSTPPDRRPGRAGHPL